MLSDSAHLIYFSPSGTTEKIVKAVMSGLNISKTAICNLTFENIEKNLKIKNAIAVIGVPVYAGRVPAAFLRRVEKITAENVPALIIAVYGNRAYDDALLELNNLVKDKGFNVIAAAAFIGEHSYSTDEKPIAASRPDKLDLDSAFDFGKKTAEKINNNDLSNPDIPGSIPYREGVKSSGISPLTDEEKCVKCGRCIKACPEHLIKISDKVITDADNCIMCCACVKSCEFGARYFSYPMIDAMRDKLFLNCSKAKKPEIFL